MTIDRETFLSWVLCEHGARIHQAVQQHVCDQQLLAATDPIKLVRETLIAAYPREFEFQPAQDDLPHGFCSD